MPWSALRWACWAGHEAIAAALLDGKYEGRGAAIDRDCGGYTPLSVACAWGNEGVVRLLLARGARQDLKPTYGTALYRAIANNRPSIIMLLSAAPGFAASLALLDRNSRTPLAAAIQRGRAACEAILRANGATH